MMPGAVQAYPRGILPTVRYELTHKVLPTAVVASTVAAVAITVGLWYFHESGFSNVCRANYTQIIQIPEITKHACQTLYAADIIERPEEELNLNNLVHSWELLKATCASPMGQIVNFPKLLTETCENLYLWEIVERPEPSLILEGVKIIKETLKSLF